LIGKRKQEEKSRPNTAKENSSNTKKLRLSYGSKINNLADDDDDEEERHIAHQRKSSGNINTPFINTRFNQTADTPGPMSVNFIQQRSIKAFRGLPNEDAARFLGAKKSQNSSKMERSSVFTSAGASGLILNTVGSCIYFASSSRLTCE